MNLSLGHAYEFQFIAGFTDLDGIYRVTHALSYDSILEQEIDLLTHLYIPAGKDEDELNTDLEDLSAASFYRLKSVDSDVDLYIPQYLISGTPVPDVREYAKIMLSIDVGAISDPVLLQSVKDTVGQVLVGSYGITSEPVVMKYASQWMSESAYLAIEEARESAKTGAVNYFTLYQQALASIVQKDAQIAALELVIDQLNTP